MDSKRFPAHVTKQNKGFTPDSNIVSMSASDKWKCLQILGLTLPL